MAKKSKHQQEAFEEGQEGQEDSGSSDGRLHITDEVRKAILYVIDEMEKIKMAQETNKEAIAGIAAKMGCKPAQVKGIINLVVKEREKGGVVQEEEQRLEWVREVIEKMEGDSDGQ